MNSISFDKFYDYFQKIILEEANSLYTDGLITEVPEFVFFKETGEYIQELDQIVYEEDKPINKKVLINITNGGGVQDPSISIETYLQMVSLEVLALDSMRDDIEKIFTNLVANYKSVLDSIDNSTFQLTIDEFPQYSERFDAHGYEKFTSEFTANFIVMPGAQLANGYKLLLSGNEINYNELVVARTTELNSDLKRRVGQKFFPNTTGFQVQVTGLYVDNPSINELLTDCAKGSKFNQYYTISLSTPSGTNIISNMNMMAKDVSFVFGYGRIISWSATFYEGITI